MSSVTLRNAGVEDAADIAGLITELGYPTAPDEMRDRLDALLAGGDVVAFVAEHEGRVLGLAGASLSRYFEKSGRYARLLVLVVADSGRRLGIGGMLIGRVEQWAKESGAREIFVNSGSHRVQAHRFYEGKGFRPTGLRFVKQIEREP